MSKRRRRRNSARDRAGFRWKEIAMPGTVSCMVLAIAIRPPWKPGWTRARRRGYWGLS